VGLAAAAVVAAGNPGPDVEAEKKMTLVKLKKTFLGGFKLSPG